MPPRIFIGGTGRSGTTILYRALGTHEDIYALPREMRFITDHHGLLNLVDALTLRYSPVQAREAVYHFDQLMRVKLSNPESGVYPGFDLPGMLGGDWYYQQLDNFLRSLVEAEFEGISAPLRDPMISKPSRSLFQRWRAESKDIPRQWHFPMQTVQVIRYFPNRNELLERVAEFIDSLFLFPARRDGKSTWCEKTPSNLMHVDFLQGLFPNSVFIHMVRDPRGVVASMKGVNWAPHEVDDICVFLQNMYTRWFALEKKLKLLPSNYLELRLEDLTADPENYLCQIASICGLSDRFIDLPEISPTAVSNWENRLTEKELRVVNQALGPVIERFGYPLERGNTATE